MDSTMRDRAKEALGAPEGTWVTPAVLAELVASLVGGMEGEKPSPAAPALSLTWRERLWLVPAETRIGVAEVVEATGRSKSWLYRLTGPSAEERIPHRKMHGELVFVVGELRHWIREHEDVIESCEMESTEAERGIRRAVETAYSGRHLTPLDGDAA